MQTSNPDDEEKNFSLIMNEINNLVDKDLMNDLGAWLNARPPMESKVVAATLALLCGDALADVCETHREACTMGQAFGDYIYNVVHWSFSENLKAPKIN